MSVLLIWSYWPSIGELWRTWQQNPDYSGGQFVPLVAAYLVWSARKKLLETPVRVSLWGLGVLLVSQLIRLSGLLFSYGSVHQYSIILAIAGAVLLIFGLNVALQLKWIGLFLLLMLPFPRMVHTQISLPLQTFATDSAVFVLELLGYLVGRNGNVLELSEGKTVAVAEACSGLRMLTAFIIVSAALALAIRRPAWQKVLLVVASVPIAILSNTIRLTATVVLYELVSGEVAEKFCHDFAGLVMMPLAVAGLAGLLVLMQWVAGGGSVRSSGRGVQTA